MKYLVTDEDGWKREVEADSPCEAVEEVAEQAWVKSEYCKEFDLCVIAPDGEETQWTVHVDIAPVFRVGKAEDTQ